MQRLIAQQTVAMAGGAPVHIGPVSLRPRFNNVATAPEPAPTRADLAEGYGAEFTGSPDPRQAAPELAAWTIASAAALAVPGVASLAWFEEWGPRGIRSDSGEQLPVAAAIVALTRLGDLLGRAAVGRQPRRARLGDRRAHRRPLHDEVLVANLDARPREVTIVVDASACRSKSEHTPSCGSVSPGPDAAAEIAGSADHRRVPHPQKLRSPSQRGRIG